MESQVAELFDKQLRLKITDISTDIEIEGVVPTQIFNLYMQTVEMAKKTGKCPVKLELVNKKDGNSEGETPDC